MPATYIWIGSGGGSLTSPSDWEEISPNAGTPAGPPGSGDLALQVNGNVGGDITVGFLQTSSVADATFTGNVTADEFDTFGVTANADTLTGLDEFSVQPGTILSAINGATIQGPSTATTSGPFGNAGFENYGTVQLNGFSSLKSYTVNDFDTMTVTSGVVTANTLSAGDISSSASLEIDSGGSITDTLGIVGISSSGASTDVTINGGDWTNGGLGIGVGNITFTVQNNGTVSANGDTTAFPGGPVMSIGGRNAGDVTNMTVDGPGSNVDVTGDLGVGWKETANVTLTATSVMSTTGPLVTAKLAATGHANFDISNGGALLQVGGDATLSVVGTTTVTLESGGTMTVAGLFDAAQGSGSSASLDVTGGVLTLSGDAKLGDGGAGSLTLDNGGSLQVTGTLDEGVQSGGSGTTLLSDASDSVTLGGDWIIGDAGAHSDTIDADVRITVPGALTLGAQQGGAGSLDLNALSASVTVNQSVTIGGAGTGSFDVAGGATLEMFSGALTLGASSGGTGTLSLAGTGSRVSVGQDITIGNSGSGSLSIGEGATLDASGGTLMLGAVKGGAGTLTLGTDVVLSPGGAVTVGDAGSGSIDLGQGATLDGSSGALSLGAAAGGAGTISLSASNAEIAAQSVQVGGGGAGLLTLADGTTVSTTGDVSLGASKGGAGTITLAAGSELSDGGNLTVGGAGGGSLDVNGGSLGLFGSQLSVGDAKGGSGDVTVANATVDITGTLLDGNAGTGTFSVNSQATLNATAVTLGSQSGGNGTFVIDGSAAEALVGSLTVGDSGTGAVQVTNAALLQVSGLASMGAQSGALVAEGATIESNGNWTVGSVLDVGQSAAAGVTVDSGGHVSAVSVVLGDNGGASGTISVTGAGTQASSLGYGTLLVVGNLGTGEVTLANGAQAGIAGAGTVEIAVNGGAVGEVTLTDGHTALFAQTLIVGGAAGGAGMLSVESGAEASAATVTIGASGTVLLSGGTLATDPIAVFGAVSGFGVLSGAIANNGGIAAMGGTLTLGGSLSGTGTVTVASGAALVLQQGAGSGQTIDLASSGVTLAISDLAATQASVAGFALGDALVFAGVTADAANFQSGTLTLENSGASVGTLAMSGSYVSADFHAVSANGTTTVDFACFAEGTHIATQEGDVPVEALRVGDRVRLADGGSALVVWLGHRRVDCRRHPRPWDVWPVRVCHGAFGAGLPRRDLTLSPDHAVFVDGVLIPVRYLVNGRTIVQKQSDTVVYFHVELPRHGVLLAEGLPCESYLDTGNRGAFANGGGATQVHPDFALQAWAAKGCAPLLREGAAVTAVRRKLLACAGQLGYRLTDDPGMRVLADGRELIPHVEDRWWRVTLPNGARTVRLMSRRWTPAHTSPDGADTRVLGVAVARLFLNRRDVSLASPALSQGWHPLEGGWRWTDGAAELSTAGAHEVAFSVAMTGTYWQEARTARALVA